MECVAAEAKPKVTEVETVSGAYLFFFFCNIGDNWGYPSYYFTIFYLSFWLPFLIFLLFKILSRVIINEAGSEASA